VAALDGPALAGLALLVALAGTPALRTRLG